MTIQTASTEEDTVVSVAGLQVEILVEGGNWSSVDTLPGNIAAALDALSRERPDIAGTVAILLSSDARVRELNRQFRGIDKPTNVLSFPSAQPPVEVLRGQTRELGDIVLAAETVLREASEQAIAPVHHVQHLVIHGLLHLAGFDHSTDNEAEAMEAVEIRALARLGIASPYEVPAPAGAAGSAS